MRRADGVRLRIVSEAAPGRGAEPVFPTLEDAYLHHLSSQREAAPAGKPAGVPAGVPAAVCRKPHSVL